MKMINNSNLKTNWLKIIDISSSCILSGSSKDIGIQKNRKMIISKNLFEITSKLIKERIFKNLQIDVTSSIGHSEERTDEIMSMKLLKGVCVIHMITWTALYTWPKLGRKFKTRAKISNCFRHRNTINFKYCCWIFLVKPFFSWIHVLY